MTIWLDLGLRLFPLTWITVPVGSKFSISLTARTTCCKHSIQNCDRAPSVQLWPTIAAAL